MSGHVVVMINERLAARIRRLQESDGVMAEAVVMGGILALNTLPEQARKSLLLKCAGKLIDINEILEDADV